MLPHCLRRGKEVGVLTFFDMGGSQIGLTTFSLIFSLVLFFLLWSAMTYAKRLHTNEEVLLQLFICAGSHDVVEKIMSVYIHKPSCI